jgi:hypothetical protein
MIKLPLNKITSLINPTDFIVSTGEGTSSGSFLSAALVRDKNGDYHIKIIDMYSCVIITSFSLQLGNLSTYTIHCCIPSGIVLMDKWGNGPSRIHYEELISTDISGYKHKDYIKELFNYYTQKNNINNELNKIPNLIRNWKYTDKVVEELKLRLETVNEKIKLLESNYST